jgi:hypothetical protein
MAKLLATRGAGYVKSAEFIWNYNDTAIDSVSGTLKTFGSTAADNIVFDCINLPVGAQLIGGDLVVETANVGATTYSVAVGIAGDTQCYLATTAAVAMAAQTRTALLVTKVLASNNGANVRLTLTTVVAATAGRYRLTLMYKLDGQLMEAVPA